MSGAAGRRKLAARRRQPTMDMLENPFCQDRQMTDAYFQMKHNANPRIHEQTSQSHARRLADLYGKQSKTVTQLNEQSPLLDPHTAVRRMNNKRAPRAIKQALNSIDGEITPHLLKVASSSFPAKHAPPLTTTESAPTFGHRPTSASRHFAPLSMSTQHTFKKGKPRRRRRPQQSMNSSTLDQSSVNMDKILVDGLTLPVAGVGMSLSNLRNLLGGDIDDEMQIEATSLGMSKHALHRQEDAAAQSEYAQEHTDHKFTANEKTLALMGMSEDMFDANAKSTDVFAAKSSKKKRIEDELKKKRDKWDSELYYSPIVRAEVTNHGPDPNESYQERLLRFTKVSAGVSRHPFCEDRQENDAKEMESDINRDLPTRKHPYLPFSKLEDKSPRTRATINEVAGIMTKEDERQKRLERTVEKHERMVANDRIAKLATRMSSV